jgi:hypothetical protein
VSGPKPKQSLKKKTEFFSNFETEMDEILSAVLNVLKVLAVLNDTSVTGRYHFSFAPMISSCRLSRLKQH